MTRLVILLTCLLLSTMGLYGCIASDPDPAAKANQLCFGHQGVRSYGADGGLLRPNQYGHAICRDGVVKEWGN